jgi:hypothetical protein
MSGRDRPSGSGSDPDDWFGDLDLPPGSSRGRSTVGADGADESGSDGTGDALTVRLGTLLAALAVVLVLLVLAGLALAGVFSGGGDHPTRTSTTSRTTTSATPTGTTTTPAPPSRPALRAPTATLKPGDQGAQVKVLQRALKGLNYGTGAVDGAYGPSTETAVKRFQQDSALTADGVLGPQTLQALEKALRRLGDR